MILDDSKIIGFGINYVYVTVPKKTDHFAQISDIEILVPHCSALFTPCNGEIRILIAYTVLE